MSKTIPFIGRNEELSTIGEIIGIWGKSHVVCVDAPGGIGKTRLLQEIYSKYEGKYNLGVVDIIDFDNTAFHIPENIELHITRSLEGTGFDAYENAMADWRKMQAIGVSPERLIRERVEIRQIFVESFNRISADQRVILLFDTLDALSEYKVWNYLQGLVFQLDNTVTIVAGRNAQDLAHRLREEADEQEMVQLIALPPLEIRQSDQYLQEKMEARKVSLGPEIAQKIIFLARGRPILIDLAVEWLSKNVPSSWLTTESLEDLENLSNEKRIRRQKEFEKQLVQGVLQIRDPIDRLIILLSRVYPLSQEMIVNLLELDPMDAEKLIQEAQRHVFVKSLPHGQISLHDEMRRMVNKYVWPDIDPGRWHDDNNQVVSYLARRISGLEEELTKLRAQPVKNLSDSESLEYFREKDAKRRELFTLRIRYMRHSFLSSISIGVKAFIEVYEAATDSYDYSLRDSIIGYVLQFEGEFSVQQRYEVKLRQARHLVDLGEYEIANEVYTDLVKVVRNEPHRRVPVFIGRGNAYIRQGETQKAISDFEAAVEISQEEEGLEDLLINSKLALGWTYRRASQLVKAAEVYNSALSLCRAKNEPELEANLLKSLGYVKALQRYQQAAVALCHQSLEMWEDLRQQEKGSLRDLGMVYSTLGEVYSEGGQLEKSLENFNDALHIFESTEDREWQSIALCGRGRTYWMMGLEYEASKDAEEVLEVAQKDLETALRIAPVMEKARILARLGWVYCDRGDIEQAESAFSESYDIALQTGEPVYELYSLAGLIKVAYQRRQGGRWREFKKQFQDFESRWEHPDKYMEPLVGYFFKSLADLAVLNDDCEQSIDFYIHSFKAWATRPMFQSYSLNRQLEAMEDEVLPYLPSDRIQELGQRLLDVWARNEKFTNEHPEVITYFSRWARRKG